MTERTSTTSGGYTGTEAYRRDTPTAWVGWIIYAGVMMITLGIFQTIAGFVGLFDHTYYHVRTSQTLLHISYNSWGGIHIALGVLAIFAGYALMAGRTWGRIYAVLLAIINATANLAFLNATPAWSIMMITIDALVIWAVCVHGNELALDD